MYKKVDSNQFEGIIIAVNQRVAEPSLRSEGEILKNFAFLFKTLRKTRISSVPLMEKQSKLVRAQLGLSK